jgi:hypothetical protein
MNLVEDSTVWVRRDGDLFEADAIPIEGEERDRLWESVVVSIAPQFGAYQEKTDRTIPLVRLVAKA